jgi:hypothetical protein
MRYTNLSNRLNDDKCALKNKALTNDSVVDNRLYNFYYNNACDCSVLDDIAFDNNFTIREGFGYASGCTVDTDSDLRMGSAVTHDKGRIQLCARTFTGVPRLTNSGLIPNVESRLRNADDTSDIRNVDKISEKSYIPLSFTPMIGCLAGQVQDPKHIIPEDNMPTWRLGGRNTRTDAVSNEYLEKCNFEYVNKNWVRKVPDQGKLGPR